jgi:sugar (pentulose or hexulose) kinase
MTTKGYLGIDAGTQGLSVIFTDENLNVLATGEAGYEMLPGLPEGCYEQAPGDWTSALGSAIKKMRSQLSAENFDFQVLAIGISGQMHGEVLADENGNVIGSTRLWCDSRNEDEGNELTKLFAVKMPKRITSARWLWTIRNEPEKAAAAARMTTPAGWLAFVLTGEWNLGIGDAAGMFPIDQTNLDYDQVRLGEFDSAFSTNKVAALADLLPAVRRAGENGGSLNEKGAELLGLNVGIPVAPAEGEQPAALAGSLIGKAGMVSVSFGTSVCANSVGDRAFTGVSDAIDHFCAADGKPINMVWLRNGTTFMNTIVKMFAAVDDGDRGFAAVMPELLQAEPNCGGLLALPFMDDEPGLGVRQGGTAMLIGLNETNSSAGNVAKAALLSTMFNLRLGSEVLDAQGFPRTELILSGGLTKTPQLGQVLADVFNTPVTMLESAEEGTAWGAALLAKFRHRKIEGDAETWSEFLAKQKDAGRKRFAPDSAAAKAYDLVYKRYRRLVEMQGQLDQALGPAVSIMRV